MLTNPERTSRSRPKSHLPTWAITALYSTLAVPAIAFAFNYLQSQNRPLPHLLLSTSAFQNPESAIDPNAPFIRLEISCLAQQPQPGIFVNPRLDLDIQVSQLDASKNLTRTLTLRDTDGKFRQILASQASNLAEISTTAKSGSIEPQKQYEVFVLRKMPPKPDKRILESNVIEAKLPFETPNCP